MSNSSLPLWWKDIVRASGNALSNYESLLDSIESLLDEPDDISEHNISGRLNRWNALLESASRASDRITSSFHLAESRRKDIAASGLNPPDNSELALRCAAASGRSMEIIRSVSDKMALIHHDLSLRRPRRPSMNLYRENTPSLIDVRV